jgi:hypothetical protein
MDFSKLIPELSQWNEGKGIDIDQWIVSVGSFEHAIAYGHLFWPEFIEHDGCIFRLDHFDNKNYQNWVKETKGDKTAVEKVMNHNHLGEIFLYDPKRTMYQEIYLAKFMKELWECKLARDFPHLPAVVELYDCETEGDNWVDCQITVFLRR